MAVPQITWRSCWRRVWNSDRVAPLRFYGHYLRWPVLFLAAALAVEKLVFYGLLPLGALAGSEWSYFLAQRDFQAGQTTSALYHVREALLNTRDDAQMWRLAARITEKLDSPEAAYCWQQVDRIEPGSGATQLALADSALAHGETELAAAALREVSPDHSSSLEFLIAAGRLAQAEGDTRRAGVCFAQAEALHPKEARALFTLADWHATKGNRSQARAILESLARRPQEQAAALRKLIDLEMQAKDLAKAREIHARLLALPNVDFADRLRALELAPDERACAQMIQELLRTSSKSEAAQVLTRLVAHGRGQEALIWIRRQDESWQENPAIGVARADCLKALGGWQHLYDDQRDSNWPGCESTRLMILAQAAAALNQKNEARVAWHEAVTTCATPEDFTALAAGADALPDGNEARAEVWAALANRYPGQQWPLRSLLQYQLACGDLIAAQNLAVRLAVLAPGDVDLQATRDLVCLLRGTQLPQVEADLERLVAHQPGDPALATAAAYSLYLQGRFAEALGTIGALEPAELRAPERAAYVGELLAAAGPVDQAEEELRTALGQPHLLEGQRRSVQRALDLVTARRLMGDLIHPRDDAARNRARSFFLARAATGQVVNLIGASVAVAGDPAAAAAYLAQVDPASLSRAELILYEGAVRLLTGTPIAAEPWLTLSGTLPNESRIVVWHRLVETWWSLRDRAPAQGAFTAGLLTAYRGLEPEEKDPSFWRHDESREMALAQTALRTGEVPEAVQARLEALLSHVPSTPDLEAEIGYALLLEGRIEAGRQRLEVLSPADLARPEPARCYAAILQACGEKQRAEAFALSATRETPTLKR